MDYVVRQPLLHEHELVMSLKGYVCTFDGTEKLEGLMYPVMAGMPDRSDLLFSCSEDGVNPRGHKFVQYEKAPIGITLMKTQQS